MFVEHLPRLINLKEFKKYLKNLKNQFKKPAMMIFIFV